MQAKMIDARVHKKVDQKTYPARGGCRKPGSTHREIHTETHTAASTRRHEDKAPAMLRRRHLAARPASDRSAARAERLLERERAWRCPTPRARTDGWPCELLLLRTLPESASKSESDKSSSNAKARLRIACWGLATFGVFVSNAGAVALFLALTHARVLDCIGPFKHQAFRCLAHGVFE